MRKAAIVEVEVAAERGKGLGHAVVGSQVQLRVYDAATQRLDEHVVATGDLAVMLIATTLLASATVKAALVNCEPGRYRRCAVCCEERKQHERFDTERRLMVIDSGTTARGD